MLISDNNNCMYLIITLIYLWRIMLTPRPCLLLIDGHELLPSLMEEYADTAGS